MNIKKIEFIPNSSSHKIYQNCLISANRNIPDWYMKSERFTEGNSPQISSDNKFATNSTIKGCPPFLDALTTGYIYTLPTDLQIKKDLDPNGEEVLIFSWMTENLLISTHSDNQLGNLPSAYNGQKSVLKWFFDYGIKTPKGYSTFFTHPINRNDLPFRTFTGVVETDTYHVPVQFPFQIMNFKEDIIILEKGTPLCQFFPFKRDTWNSEIIEYDENFVKRQMFNLRSKIIKSYKKQFWVKKSYR